MYNTSCGCELGQEALNCQLTGFKASPWAIYYWLRSRSTGFEAGWPASKVGQVANRVVTYLSMYYMQWSHSWSLQHSCWGLKSLGDRLMSGPQGCLQPRELLLFNIFFHCLILKTCTLYVRPQSKFQSGILQIQSQCYVYLINKSYFYFSKLLRRRDYFSRLVKLLFVCTICCACNMFVCFFLSLLSFLLSVLI